MAKLDGYSVRIEENGLIWMPRSNPQAVKHFDRYYEKVGKLQWRKRIYGPSTMNSLRFKYTDMPCYIVGKGVSLKHLGIKTFQDQDAPIIAINEAINYVNDLNLYPDTPVYFIQQDPKPVCKVKDSNTVLLHSDIGNRYPTKPHRHVFENSDFGFSKKMMSVFVAIGLAKYFGCNRLILISFDYALTEDPDYPEDIPDHRTGIEAWKNLKARIRVAAEQLQVDYVTPVPEMECKNGTPAHLFRGKGSFMPNLDPEILDDDNILPSPDSLAKHHE